MPFKPYDTNQTPHVLVALRSCQTTHEIAMNYTPSIPGSMFPCPGRTNSVYAGMRTLLGIFRHRIRTLSRLPNSRTTGDPEAPSYPRSRISPSH